MTIMETYKGQFFFSKCSKMLLILLTTIFNFCNGANILGIVATPSYSHQLAYMNIWNELSAKGHKVTVLTTNPQNNPNLTEIDLSISYNFLKPTKVIIPKDVVEFYRFVCNLSIEVDVFYFNLPKVQDLMNNKNNLHFDVVMAETFKPELLIFGELFKAPTILLTSYEDSFMIHKAFQNYYHSILYPDLTVPYAGELNFVQRFSNFITQWRVSNVQKQCFAKKKHLIDKYFTNISSTLTIEEMIAKASMLFVAVSPVLLYPRPLSARTVIIGGGTTIKPAKTLEKDIQRFLDSSKLGAIYFSLGSNVKSEAFDHQTIEKLIQLLKNLPYRILWKFTNNGSYIMPKNVLTASWWPQQDILRHPNVKLFITQGGIQSLEEAIHFGKPLVGIPMFGDQESNLKRMEVRGILKYVASIRDFDGLKKAIVEVMENEEYVENIRKLNEVNLDQPMSGLEKAVWWTEYVIRHKGNVDHMVHNFEKEIPWYQYYFLDLILFLGALGVILVSVLYLFVKVIVRRIYNGTIVMKNKKEN